MSNKKIIILFSLLVSINTAFPQSDSIEIKLQKIAAEKKDNARIDLIMSMSLNSAETNPIWNMQIAPKGD